MTLFRLTGASVMLGIVLATQLDTPTYTVAPFPSTPWFSHFTVLHQDGLVLNSDVK